MEVLYLYCRDVKLYALSTREDEMKSMLEPGWGEGGMEGAA
jgi:hypothetical protein